VARLNKVESSKLAPVAIYNMSSFDDNRDHQAERFSNKKIQNQMQQQHHNIPKEKEQLHGSKVLDKSKFKLRQKVEKSESMYLNIIQETPTRNKSQVFTPMTKKASLFHKPKKSSLLRKRSGVQQSQGEGTKQITEQQAALELAQAALALAQLQEVDDSPAVLTDANLQEEWAAEYGGDFEYGTIKVNEPFATSSLVDEPSKVPEPQRPISRASRLSKLSDQNDHAPIVRKLSFQKSGFNSTKPTASQAPHNLGL